MEADIAVNLEEMKSLITIDSTTKSTLALVQELTSIERVDKRYWWFEEIKPNVDLKFINDTLAHHLPLEIEPVGPAVLRVEKVVNYHLPLEWEERPLEPVGPAVLHVERSIQHHMPLNLQPVGPIVVSQTTFTWALALRILDLINRIPIIKPERLKPILDRLAKLESAVSGS